MSRFEISTCFMDGVSDIDPTAVHAAVTSVTGNEIWDETWFMLQTDNCFNGGRLSHTNVRVIVPAADVATAQKIQRAVSEATGRRWNAPTQDPDERDKELGERDSWGMFTTEGALAVDTMVEKLDGALRSGALSPILLGNRLNTERDALAKAGHGEVFDTAVRERLGEHFDRVLEELGITMRDYL